MAKMKRASYRAGIEWIAINDEPECDDPEEVAYQVSSLLLADLFGVDPERVGRDIIRKREKIHLDDQMELPDVNEKPTGHQLIAGVAAWRADPMARRGKFGEQVMPKIRGEVFRCNCGSNCFTRLSPVKFSCNGCRDVYVASKDVA
jgi:hypothetical protein